MLFSWVGARFGFAHFGTLTGLMMFCGGAVCLTVNPVVEAAATSSEAFQVSFLVLAGIGVVSSLPLTLLSSNPMEPTPEKACSETGKANKACDIGEATGADTAFGQFEPICEVSI